MFQLRTHIKKIILLCIILSASIVSFAQKPKDGTYTYSIAFSEWGGKSLGTTCTVIIKGDSIKIIHNGKAGLTGKKDDVLEQGIIMKHIRTGKWIIGHSVKDKEAKEIGGCSEGPSIIDFKGKKYWVC
jgi:hypothetical protein